MLNFSRIPRKTAVLFCTLDWLSDHREGKRANACEAMQELAERVGFEPTVRFPVRSLSRRVLSTTQSPLRGHCNLNPSKGSAFRQCGLAHAAVAPISCAVFASEIPGETSRK
jgi:hypothetical protein